MLAFYVYILQSESTGKIYIGQTDNLNRRVAQHNSADFKGTLHTKRNKGPWKLVYSEECFTRKEAMQRERRLKSGQGREWIHKTILNEDADSC